MDFLKNSVVIRVANKVGEIQAANSLVGVSKKLRHPKDQRRTTHRRYFCYNHDLVQLYYENCPDGIIAVSCPSEHMSQLIPRDTVGQRINNAEADLQTRNSRHISAAFNLLSRLLVMPLDSKQRNEQPLLGTEC